MLTKQDLNFLSKTLTFGEKLSISEKDLILNHTSLNSYRQGENLHSGTNDCVGVFLVKEGILRTYLLSDEGKEVTLFRLYPGDVCILSASCLLKNITFDVHIDAEESTEALLISSAIFSKLVSDNIYAENFSYKIAMERFSDVIWAMEQLLFMRFDKRLALFLLDEISKNNNTILSLTHEQIAKYIGSAREVVSRMLKHFEKEGIVKLSRGEIKVLNPTKLKNIS